MPTLIAFSAEGSDYVKVNEEPRAVHEALIAGANTLPVELTRDRDGEPIWINPTRVAYFMAPIEHKSASF